MTSLWKKRQRAHFLEMLKYLRYVLNDHFVIALLFLVGGLGYGYSNFLKTIDGPSWWSAPVVILCLAVLVQFGSLATLFQKADPVFLLPREHDMHGYLKQALFHSWLFSLCVEILGFAILYPFLSIAVHFLTFQVIVLGLSLPILKLGSLFLALNQLYRNSRSNQWRTLVLNWGLPILWFVGGLYLNVWITLIGAVIQCLVEILYEAKQWQLYSLGWRLAIQIEDQRMLRIYRFFNLFTDVPNIRGTVHRRKYFDGILKWADRNTSNPYVYLFMRALVRSTEYSGMYFRLTLLGMVLLIFISNLYLSLFLQILFVYLISFQLLPLLINYEENVFTHLYPIQKSIQVAGFNWVMVRLLVATVVLFGLAAGIAHASVLQGVVSLMIGFIESWMLLKLYFPTRIKKMTS